MRVREILVKRIPTVTNKHHLSSTRSDGARHGGRKNVLKTNQFIAMDLNKMYDE